MKQLIVDGISLSSDENETWEQLIEKLEKVVKTCFKSGFWKKKGKKENAVKKKINLREADLRGANLLWCKMDKKVLKQIENGWFEWEIVEDKGLI